MRKGWIVTAALCAAAGLALGWQIPVEAPTVSERSPTAVYRVVGEWQGCVAVFAPDADTPETVYDTAVSSLPPSVQEALKKGVEATDASTLKILLEELLS